MCGARMRSERRSRRVYLQRLPIASGHRVMIRDPMPRRGRRRPEVGQRISAAKKGKPLVARGPDEATVQQSVSETRLSAKVLREGAHRQLRFERGEDNRPGLRHRRLPHANGGIVIVFHRAERDEDLARLPCEWCDAPAPGDSGRCRRHQAKKYATVERVCDWERCPRKGEPLMRYGSKLHEHSFCSDECQFAWQRATDSRFGSTHAPFDADSARERYQRLEPRFDEAKAELGLPLDVHQVAAATHTSTAVIRAHAPELGGKVILIDGAEQLALPADAPERYARAWAGRAHVSDEHWTGRRERFLDADFMELQQRALGRVLTVEQRDQLRNRIAARRKLLTRRRAGAPRKAELYKLWRSMFYELRPQLAGWSDFQVCVSVADRDLRENPEEWRRYTPADDGGLRAEDERKAAQRVWAAIS